MYHTIHALLVDDEVGCIDNLQHYLSVSCPRIRVAGKADNLSDAALLIKNLSIDIAFLDVHLFDQNVFDLLPSTWQPEVPIVFVTAYDHYAMRAFQTSAIDYLLKPLETNEVRRCYRKIEHYFDGGHPNPSQAPLPETIKAKKYTVRQGDHVYLLNTDHIVLLKANGFYTEIYFEHDGKLKNIVLSKPINQVHEEIDSPSLMRVHRSYVINLHKVTEIRKLGASISLGVGDNIIPVAKRRTSTFLERYSN